ncbi:MAG: response regulator [Flaviaesturariibacter sp.]|nr:response regulator [Flaviaesturariibacter sp.]
MREEHTEKRLVLFADDDRDDLDLVCRALEPFESIELKPFLYGGQILTHIEKLGPSDRLPCLVILDINMPVVTGKDVLRRMRERPLLSSIPVVLFTTSSLDADMEYARLYNAHFITKPLHTGQMEIVVRQLVALCGAEVGQD